MDWMFDHHPECCATGAYCNGQMIYVDGRMVREEQVAADELMRLARALEQSGRAILTMYDVSVGDFVSSAYYISESEAYAQHMMDELPGMAKRHLSHLDAPAYTKTNVHALGTREEQTELRDWMRAEFPTMDFVFPSPFAPVIDILPHGWSKASAVQVIVDELGITLDEVAVFGDSENDLAMIEYVPNAVAVANATDQIKRASAWEIGSSADDAVADALLDIAAAAKTGEMASFMRR
jgi:HAD superfamily hydrolase (TIGR01484 family)